MGNHYSVPTLALGLMLVGVLLPSAMYSFRLHDPTPAELLIAICIGLFSSVVFLWILDAISILRFRAEWVSKSIYGAAIVSVLGTSVAVYKDAFATRKYPYEGLWELQITSWHQMADLSLPIVFTYSEGSGAYWGYSEYRPSTDPVRIVWVQATEFSPRTVNADLTLRILTNAGQERRLSQALSSDRKGKVFVGALSEGAKIRLSRPN